MRLVLSVALFLFCSLCLADEWEDALQLDSWDEVQAYWQIEQLPRMDDLSAQPEFNEYLHVELETLIRTDGVPETRVVRSSGNPAFDRSSADVTDLLRFKATEAHDPPRAVVYPHSAHTQPAGD